RIADERRNEEPERYAAHRGHKHDAQIDPKHPPYFQDVIADQNKEHRLNEGEDTERERFRDDVVGQSNVKVALALKHRPVANDIVSAIGWAEENRYVQTEKQE